jgi:uncharacterized protein
VRVFLDTNVLVSAFAARGICADLLEIVLLEHELVTGRAVLRELDKALRTKVKLPAARTATIVEFIASEAAEVGENAKAARAKAHPDDALVLGESLDARAEVFVTGDAALLALVMLGPMKIASPRAFWDLLRAQ